MSVVNKMLRDLENREQPITNSADYVPPKLAIKVFTSSIKTKTTLLTMKPKMTMCYKMVSNMQP
jgi:hypothetical protein